MILTLFTDGGSLNNPGPSAYGYVIFTNNIRISEHSEQIGIATNNVAEYTGLVRGLEKILALINTGKITKIEKIIVKADSSLMVNQLNGIYKVKNAKIREFVFKVRSLECELKIPITYSHVYREQNHLADALVKKALNN